MGETWMKCHIHEVEYDFMHEQCPKCLEEFKIAERILERFTCGLCGELKASTQVMCGGAIGRLCQDCRTLILKWEQARKRHEDRFLRRRKEGKER